MIAYESNGLIAFFMFVVVLGMAAVLLSQIPQSEGQEENEEIQGR